MSDNKDDNEVEEKDVSSNITNMFPTASDNVGDLLDLIKLEKPESVCVITMVNGEPRLNLAGIDDLFVLVGVIETTKQFIIQMMSEEG